MDNFALRLRYLRALNGITQEKLASNITEIFNYPLTKAAISQYENNKRTPELDLLVFFALYFECSLDYLAGRVDEKKSTIDSFEYAKKIRLLNLLTNSLDKLALNQVIDLEKLIVKFLDNI